MKYIFEYNEITKCLHCPFRKIWEYDEEIYCRLKGEWNVIIEKPEWCPLEIVK